MFARPQALGIDPTDTANYWQQIRSSNILVVVSGSAPSFFHVLAFSLFSTAATNNFKSNIKVVVSWVFIGYLFEFLQRDNFISDYIRALNSTDISALRYIHNYFIYGTFDTNDLYAITLGGIAAAVITMVIYTRRAGYE